jgi:hypothetical protein
MRLFRYKSKKNKKQKVKNKKTKNIKTKNIKTKNIKTSKKGKTLKCICGGMFRVKPEKYIGRTGATHINAELPHYHISVLLPNKKTATLDLLYAHSWKEDDSTGGPISSARVVNILNQIRDRYNSKPIALFWRGKRLLPQMKLRDIVEGDIVFPIDEESSTNPENRITCKYIDELSLSDIDNIAHTDPSPNTPREDVDESEEEYINYLNSLVEQRKNHIDIISRLITSGFDPERIEEEEKAGMFTDFETAKERVLHH